MSVSSTWLKEYISSLRKSQFRLWCLTLLLHWNAELLHWRRQTTNSLQSLWESHRSLEYLNVSLNSQHTHFLAHILIILKDEPYVSLLISLNLSPTWSQNMIVILSLEQRMRHLQMPLKALLSMLFFIFNLDKSESITLCLEGRSTPTTHSKNWFTGACQSRKP